MRDYSATLAHVCDGKSRGLPIAESERSGSAERSTIEIMHEQPMRANYAACKMENRKKTPHSAEPKRDNHLLLLLFINAKFCMPKSGKKLNKKPQHFCLSTRTPATDCDYNSLTHNTYINYMK